MQGIIFSDEMEEYYDENAISLQFEGRIELICAI